MQSFRHLTLSLILLGGLLHLANPAGAQSQEAWKTHLMQGQQLSKQGQHHAALRHYDLALSQNPNAWEVYLHKAQSYEKQGKHEQVIANYGLAMQMHPRLAQAYLQRAAYFKRRGQNAQALYDLDQGLINIPYNPDLLYARGDFYLGHKRHQEALQDFLWATRVRPGMSQAYAKQAHCYHALQDWVGYEQALTGLIQHGGGQPEIYLSRAKVRLLLKQGPAAQSDLNAVLARAPKSTEALHIRGKLSLAQGPSMCESALKDLRQACKLGEAKACFKKAPCVVPTPEPTPETAPTESPAAAAAEPAAGIMANPAPASPAPATQPAPAAQPAAAPATGTRP